MVQVFQSEIEAETWIGMNCVICSKKCDMRANIKMAGDFDGKLNEAMAYRAQLPVENGNFNCPEFEV